MFYISNELSHHGVKGMKWGVRNADKASANVGSKSAKFLGEKDKNRIGKVVGKTYKVNEGIERKKSAVASKLGAKKTSEKYKNNADYYSKTSKDLISGKVGTPKTKYQKAMRWLGKSTFATRSIIRNDTPGVKLTKQQQAQALAEQHLMRKADGWYKKKSKRMATIKVADLVLG